MKRALIILFSMLLCSSVFAAPFNEIIVFGDSLSDNGNVYRLFKVPKSPPYFQGRFTNGNTWAEHVGNYYYKKYYIDTQNYAWGGATAYVHSPITDDFIAPISLEGELYKYYLSSVSKDKSNALYVIWIGANDYLYERQPDMEGIAKHVVKNIEWAVNSLIKKGAKNFLILNMPELSASPYSKERPETHDRYQTLTMLHNNKLTETISAIQNANPLVKIVSLDVFHIFNDLVANPEKYNQKYNVKMKNFTEACWMGGISIRKNDLKDDLNQALTDENGITKKFDANRVADFIMNSPSLAEAYSVGKGFETGNAEPCTNAEEYIFWDSIHPTAIMHNILAQIVIDTLETKF